MTDTGQLVLDFDSNGVRPKAARPLGPWPVEADGVTVRVPILDRFLPSRIGATLIDAADYGLVMTAGLLRTDSHGYVINGRKVPLQNVIMQPPSGYVVDHVRHEPKDNRRSELRVVTISENAANRRRPKNGTCASSRFRGVTLHRDTGKWQAAASHMGRCRHAGIWRNEEDAARAYDRLAARLWPGVALLNFPHEHHEDSDMQHIVTLEQDKVTRGAVRFREVDSEGNPREQAESVIGTIYLRKSVLAGQEPKRITVTVETQAA